MAGERELQRRKRKRCRWNGYEPLERQEQCSLYGKHAPLKCLFLLKLPQKVHRNAPKSQPVGIIDKKANVHFDFYVWTGG